MSQHDDRAARLLHLGVDGLAKGEARSLPLVQTSTFHLPGDPAGVPGYGRMNNPTWEATEEAIAVLEDAPTKLFPSGMAAIAAALFATLKTGDRLLLPSDGYYTTRLLADDFLAPLGVTVETRSSATFEDGGFDGFAVVFIETPSNPGLDVVDLRATCAAIRAAGGISVVDNTTMTALGQRPLDLGADIVVASDTKAPAGHSDVLAGHVSSRDSALIERVALWRKLSGAIPGPHEAWLLHRSLETLEVRFERMCASAAIIAERLSAHPAVSNLRYPGLAADPGHDVARGQMTTGGFLIGFELADEAMAEAFLANCPLIDPTTSFGGTHSSAERRARWGDAVAPGFLRLSIGLEPVDTLWSAIDAALAR